MAKKKFFQEKIWKNFKKLDVFQKVFYGLTTKRIIFSLKLGESRAQANRSPSDMRSPVRRVH